MREGSAQVSVGSLGFATFNRKSGAGCELSQRHSYVFVSERILRSSKPYSGHRQARGRRVRYFLSTYCLPLFFAMRAHGRNAFFIVLGVRSRLEILVDFNVRCVSAILVAQNGDR